MAIKLEEPPKFTEMLKPKAAKVPAAPRGAFGQPSGTWAQQHQARIQPGVDFAGPAARATAVMQKATPPAVGRPIQPASAFANNPNSKFANAPAPAPAPAPATAPVPMVSSASAPQIDAPVTPSAAVSPPSPDPGFMQRVQAAMPAAEKKYGFNMATGEIAPPSKGAAGPVGPAGPQRTAADGMKSIADYNRRMAIPQRKPDSTFGTGMNGEEPMLSKPFGAGMNGEDPIVARMPRRTRTPTPPTPEPAASPYESRMASMLQGDTAGLDQPQPAQSALMTDPPIDTTPQQDPFFAKLEGSLRGAKVVPAGRRGARRGATIKGGQFSGQLLSDVMDRQRRMAIPTP